MEVRGQLHAPTALPSEKELPVPIGQEDEWTSEPVRKQCWREEDPAPTRNRTRSLVTKQTAIPAQQE
jgi:hypothetical protein